MKKTKKLSASDSGNRLNDIFAAAITETIRAARREPGIPLEIIAKSISEGLDTSELKSLVKSLKTIIKENTN